MFIEKGGVVSKAADNLNLQKRKFHENPEQKKQAMKRRYDDKKEFIKTGNTAYKKAEYQ